MPAKCYPDKSPKVDTLLDILSNDVRRNLIHFFENETAAQTVSLDDAVAHLVRRIPRFTPEEMRMVLHHRHLPKLDDIGWIEYDARSGDIRYTGTEAAERLLTDVRDVFSK